jgi:hypothetical protein
MPGSLQDRSPTFIPPSQSVTESSHNNGKSTVSIPDFILSANYDPLGSSSESDGAEDAGVFSLGTQPNIPRSPSVRIIGSKRNLFSAPATVFSEQRLPNERSRLLDPALSSRYFSIQADDRRDDPSPSTEPLDPEDHDLPAIENNSRCCSWCPDRPLWPEPTKCTLPDPLNEIKKRSDFFLSPRPNHAVSSSDESNDSLSFEESDSSSPHGSPPKAGDGILPSTDGDSDDSEIAFDIPPHPAIVDDQSLINLQSPVGAPIGTSIALAHLSVLPSYDLERGDLPAASTASHAGALSPREAWLQLLDDIKDLYPTTKTQLTDFFHQILNGKSTWVQRIGKWLIGPLIGVGFAWGMGPVYDGGLMYLANISETFNEFLSGNASTYLILYITYSAGPDGIARNAHLWKEWIAYLFSQEKKEGGRICIATAIAAATALIPVAYLILAENIPRERFQLPNWDNVFGVAVIERGIPLLIDAFANDFYITWNSISNLEDWCRQFTQVFFPSSLPPQMKSFEEIQTKNQREKFDHNLTKLKHFLVGASSTVIEAIYKDVQDVIAGARSAVDLGAQQAFAAVSYLLSLGDEVQEVAKKNSKKSIAEIAFDGLKWTCLILGAPTVALLLELVGSTVTSLFTSNGGVADSSGEAFALVAFLPFIYVLAQSMDNFKNLVLSKDPRGHESHPGIRLPVKVFIGIQSFVYLFQTSVAVLQGYQKWFGDGWWPFAAGIPFFIPKLMGLAYNFNGTFNEQVTTSAINAYHRIGGKCRGSSLCTPCQKDWLIRLVESSRSNLEHWNPELIHNLTKGVKIFKDEESNISLDEI